MRTTTLLLILGPGLIVVALAVRLRYGPRQIFGKYTKPIFYGMLFLLSCRNLWLWLNDHHDVWALPVATIGFVAVILGAIEMRRTAIK